MEQARRYAEEAQQAFASQLAETPDDSQLHVVRGLALAYLGRRQEAMREGERGVALEPLARIAFDGVYLQHQLVRIYRILGEREKALDLFEQRLKMPYYLSRSWLAIDPNFAPLKGNPRFEKLLRPGDRRPNSYFAGSRRIRSPRAKEVRESTTQRPSRVIDRP
jgi:tetratricopeptide (TPR) repeat protein